MKEKIENKNIVVNENENINMSYYYDKTKGSEVHEQFTLHGSIKTYYSISGQLKSESIYEKGKCLFSRAYHKNGIISSMQLSPTNNRRISYSYYDNGNISEIRTSIMESNKHPKFDGVYKSFYKDSSKKYECNYVKGKIIGIAKRWTEDGKYFEDRYNKDGLSLFGIRIGKKQRKWAKERKAQNILRKRHKIIYL